MPYSPAPTPSVAVGTLLRVIAASVGPEGQWSLYLRLTQAGEEDIILIVHVASAYVDPTAHASSGTRSSR